MRTYKYVGTFVYLDENGKKKYFQLTVNCNGFTQAMILLMADAIREGKQYQVGTIVDEKGTVKRIDEQAITKITNLIG
jgi:hypothetical protein